MESANEANSAAKPTILVVEDDILTRLAVSDCLHDAGFVVAEAASAAEAVAILQSERPAIELVFSDLRLPGRMDGLGLTGWIKANRPWLRVMLTSGDDRMAASARELDHDIPFVPKPYDVPRLVSAMRKLIDAPKRPGGDRYAQVV